MQGPLEQHAELNAEDAWSTADAVSETWQPPGAEGRRRETGAFAERTGTTSTEGRPDPVPRARAAFRGELHGLRALALGLVAVYHIWLGRVSGGVDVFLFLSAFLLTGTFVRRLETGSPLSVPRYWLHVFKRLLPPAAITILLTLGATAAFLPSSLWPTVMQQAVASAAYVQNALLALMHVDYHAQDAGTASPLQHFWSLSMQGQAFVLWPLLFALMVPLARRGRGVRRPLIALMLVIGVASLVWSVMSTQSQQEIAYFDTSARLWEFAAGSLLALALPLLDRITGARRPEEQQPPRLRTTRALLGWAGIAALLACGIVVDVSTQFPGWIAIWPLAAAGAVVLAGYSGRAWGVDRVLSTRPAAFFGDISYALYLVHWPILVVWLHTSDQERAGLLDGLAVLVASVLMAWLLTRAVDAPVRRSRWLEARPWRALTAVAASFALVAAASGGWWMTLNSTRAPDPAVAPITPAAPEPTPPTPTTTEPAFPLDEVATTSPPEVRPLGWQVGGQWPNLPVDCEGPWEPEEPWRAVDCQQLLPGDAEAQETFVVVGSSHARQHIPALLPTAQERDAQVVNLAMDGCEFVVGVPRTEYCSGYEDWVLDYLDEMQPDLLLTSVTRSTEDSAEESMLPGTDTAVQEVLDRGIDVVVVRDNPRWTDNQFECAEAVITDGGTPADADEACGADLSEKLAEDDPAHDLADLTAADAEVTAFDLTEYICPDERCSPVLGDVYVYMDEDHLSRVFVEEVLEPVVTEHLADAGDG